MFCQIGGWFVEQAVLQDVVGTQVRRQQLTYVGFLFFETRGSSQPTHRTSAVRVPMMQLEPRVCEGAAPNANDTTYPPQIDARGA